MYMDVLEQEVEALSAEVTRLRLMVHRVTQVMEAPPTNVRTHVDPTRSTPPLPPAAVTQSPSGDLQATVDSYKQLLPLIQLLLDQQQRSNKRRAETSRRSRHRHRSRRSPSTTASSSSSYSTPSSSAASSASRGCGQRSAPASHTPVVDAAAAIGSRTPLPQQRREKDTKGDTQRSAGVPLSPPSVAGPPSATAAAEKASKTLAAHRVTHLPTSSPSVSVVDRLRAQRGLTTRIDAEEGSSSSTNSSDVMPTFTSLKPSVNTSTSPSAKRSHTNSPAAAQAGGAVKADHSDVLINDVPPQRKASQSLLSSKMFDAPRAAGAATQSASRRHVESFRSGSIAVEDGGYYEFSPVVSVLDVGQEGMEVSLKSRSGVPPAAAHHHGPSTANSVEFSEQGRYEFSALGSLANSPAPSHMPDEAARSARTGTATAASTALDVSRGSRHQPQNTISTKQLPAQTSGMSRAPGVLSESSSSSDEDVPRKAVVSAVSPAARPFGSGVVLGTRRPISAHSPSSSAALRSSPSMGRTNPNAAATPAQGTKAMAALRSVQSTDTSSNGSDSSDASTTSSSAAAVAAAIFHRQQPKKAAKEDHRDSSFHNYSEAASSPPGSQMLALSPQRQQRRRDPAAATPASQDALNNTFHSGHRSAQSSPPRREKERAEASAEFSRVMSHSVSRPQTAHSESLAASSVGRRGSLASGGYYYGYDFGMGTPSQQSVVSNGAGERGTPSSSPGYDY